VSAGKDVALPVALLAAIGERMAAAAQVSADESDAKAVPLTRLARLEAQGLQLQQLAHIAMRVAGGGTPLRREQVDLGLALVQTVAEWSGEAARLGVELHGPALGDAVHTSPAAVKHLLDLLLEHALQQGSSVRLQLESPADGRGVCVVARISSAPASACPARETAAWQLLHWFSRALGWAAEREALAQGERAAVLLPRA
jgi:hypothetical protein